MKDSRTPATPQRAHASHERFQHENAGKIDNKVLFSIAESTGIRISREGQDLILSGTGKDLQKAKVSLLQNLAMLHDGTGITSENLTAIMNEKAADSGVLKLHTPLKMVETIRPRQMEYIRAMTDHDLTMGCGPAGTGKTYLAVAFGISAIESGEFKRLLITRPAVEAGEKLGFQPGDMKAKIDPYLRPIYDALYEMLGREETARRLESGEIEIAPLAFMRGRTLDAFIILDEAQNTTPEQMKMFLTRLGKGAKAVINGDLTQKDLVVRDPVTGAIVTSGLADALDALTGSPKIGLVEFTKADCVRSPIVEHVLDLYEDRDARRKAGMQPSAAPAPGRG